MKSRFEQLEMAFIGRLSTIRWEGLGVREQGRTGSVSSYSFDLQELPKSNLVMSAW